MSAAIERVVKAVADGADWGWQPEDHESCDGIAFGNWKDAMNRELHELKTAMLALAHDMQCDGDISRGYWERLRELTRDL